jgi:hypothetical protein
MKSIKQGLDEAYNKVGDNAYFANGFHAGVEFAESVILTEDEFPSIKNGLTNC